MDFRKIILAAAGAAFALSAGAAVKDVTVNGTKITAAEQEQVIAAAVSHGQKRSPQLEEGVRQELIARAVVLGEAEKAGLEKTPAVQAQLKNARAQILSQAYFANYVKKNPVSEADVKKAYDEQKARYGKTEYHVAHIAVKSQADAEAAQARLAKGESFAKVARAVSIDPAAKKNGGDLGWINEAALPPPMVSALSSLKGSATTVLQGPAGFEVIQNKGIRKAKALPAYAKVKGDIRRALEAQKVNAHVKELLSKASVK